MATKGIYVSNKGVTVSAGTVRQKMKLPPHIHQVPTHRNRGPTKDVVAGNGDGGRSVLKVAKVIPDPENPPTAPRKCFNPGYPQHPWMQRPKAFPKNTFPTYLTGPKSGQ